MFVKLTDNETGMDTYLNSIHMVRIMPNGAGEGTLIFMTEDAGLAPRGEAQIAYVHENAEEVFRLISKMEKAGGGKPGGNRGLI